MATCTHNTYQCDKCGKSLPSWKNTMCISTEKDKFSFGWARLRVKIEHHHGVNNNGKQDNADLCQECCIELLEDALARVKSGIRATQGSESIYEEKWNK